MKAGAHVLPERRRGDRHGIPSLREDVRCLLWLHGSELGIGRDTSHHLRALVRLVRLVPDGFWDGPRVRATVPRTALRDDWWLGNMEAECPPPLRALGFVREFARTEAADGMRELVPALDLRGLRPMLPVLRTRERERLRRERELDDLRTAARCTNREVSDLLDRCVAEGPIGAERARLLRDRVVGRDFIDRHVRNHLDEAGIRRRLRNLDRLRRLPGSLRGGRGVNPPDDLRRGSFGAPPMEHTDVDPPQHRSGRGAALRRLRPLQHRPPEPEKRR